MTTAQWWRGTVGYEIYPRSFADSNGDGIGDLDGIRRHLDHLVDLGVDALWIAPFYPSPGHDHGYDVADYRDIADYHGTLEDFDRLVAEAHDKGLRVIVDIVPNHSSSENAWFLSSRSSRDSEHRDWYIWKDPAPDGGPPNNWVSHFGGPAWTLDEGTGQYWCHLFLPEQPDFNWENEQVREAFDETLRFWCERGADGFRIDVAHALMKHQSFADNPRVVDAPDPDDPGAVFNSFEHLYDLGQESTVRIFERWNDVVEPYGAVLIGEVGHGTPERLEQMVASGDALHTAFHLNAVWEGWKPEWLLGELEEVQRRAPGGISWVIDNHDKSRSVSRYGGGALGRQRSAAVTALQMALGGMPFLYQGQELGLDDGKIDPADLADPISTRNDHGDGRDGARTAMPWTTGWRNGFTTAPEAWLRSEDRGAEETVVAQSDDSTSPLSWYRSMLAIRREHPGLWETRAEWSNPTPTSAALRRGDIVVLSNLGDEPVTFDVDEVLDVALVSYGSEPPEVQSSSVVVAPTSTVWLTPA